MQKAFVKDIENFRLVGQREGIVQFSLSLNSIKWCHSSENVTMIFENLKQ